MNWLRVIPSQNDGLATFKASENVLHVKEFLNLSLLTTGHRKGE
jgi:hypothetical protein